MRMIDVAARPRPRLGHQLRRPGRVRRPRSPDIKTILSAIFTTALNDQVVRLHPCGGVKTPTVARKPRIIVTPRTVRRRSTPRCPKPDAQLLVETDDRIRAALGRTHRTPRPRPRHRRPGCSPSPAPSSKSTPSSNPDGDRFLVKDYPKDKEYRRLKLSPADRRHARRPHPAETASAPSDLLFAVPAPEPDADSRGHRRHAEPPPRGPRADRTQRRRPHLPATAPSPPTTSARCRCPHCTHRLSPPTAPNAAPPAKTTPAAPARPRRHRRPHPPPLVPPPHLEPRHSATAGLDTTVRVHDLRHAHASWLLAGGADIQTVKERLGHGSLRTTEKYLHTLPDADDTALDALARTRTRTAK